MRQRQLHNTDATPVASSSAGGIFKKALTKVDMYPKLHKEFKVQTKTGGQMSLMVGALMIILFLSELYHYMKVERIDRMVVDNSINTKLKIDFNISFPSLSCKFAHMNAMDVAGDLQTNMHHEVYKTRLSSDGKPIEGPISKAIVAETLSKQLTANYCGSCFGAKPEKECCNTCDAVRDAYMDHGWKIEEADKSEQCRENMSSAELNATPGEGCRLHGSINVNRVAGNFHVALGRTFHRDGHMVHSFLPGEERTYNASHIIHSLSFGDPFPGMVNSLDATQRSSEHIGAVFQYFVKIIPTQYNDGAETVVTNQLSYTTETAHMDIFGRMTMLPGFYMIYDLSAFMMKSETRTVPFTHFLSKLCAIIGGLLSVASFVDSYLYHRKTGGGNSKK